ncbi:MAG TPA: hypothetical protein VFE67_09420 [Rudaea sp.]|jgi:hypothetical protein|nr:hypothetical protein [Rudaea sp.]
MPGPINVTLDVRNAATGPAPGYTAVTASNGTAYYYKYGGGSDGNGNVTVKVGGGQAAITVTVGSDPRYTITNFTFSPQGGFTWHAGGHAAVAVIVDPATVVEDVKYTTIVTDTTANCTIPCDPVIRNVP